MPLTFKERRKRHVNINECKVEDKNPRSNAGVTPLHIAAQRGHFKVCKLIVDDIVDKNPTAAKSRLTPLHVAAKNGQLEVCKISI